MEVVWTRFMSLLAIWLVTGSPSVGVNGEVLQKKDSSPKDLGLGKVLELLQLMESKLERNAKVQVETQASTLKRVGKLANPFEDHKCNKTEDILQSDTYGKVHSNTSFSNVTFDDAQQSAAANTTSGGAQQSAAANTTSSKLPAVNRDRRAARRKTWTVGH